MRSATGIEASYRLTGITAGSARLGDKGVIVTFDIRRIWQDVLTGDQTAWRRLIDLYAPLVFTVARRAGLATSDAEDCSQQTWLALYRRRRSIKDPAALPAWLIRTAHRKALTIHARSGRPISAGRELASQAATETPDAVLASLERITILQTALAHLDPRCRLLLTHLYLNPEEKSYAEIARELKINPNSLGPLRGRCMDKLKKLLKNLGYEAD